MLHLREVSMEGEGGEQGQEGNPLDPKVQPQGPFHPGKGKELFA